MTEASPAAQAHNKVVEGARLADIMLMSSWFRASPDYDLEADTAQKFVDQSILGDLDHDEDAKMLAGRVRCRVWMNRAADKVLENDTSMEDAFDKGLFAVEANYLVAFDVVGDHEKEALTEFFNRMAPFSTWPYFRAHVAHLAGEARIDVPIMPIKKLFHPVKEAGGYVDPTFEGSGETLP